MERTGGEQSLQWKSDVAAANTVTVSRQQNKQRGPLLYNKLVTWFWHCWAWCCPWLFSGLININFIYVNEKCSYPGQSSSNIILSSFSIVVSVTGSVYKTQLHNALKHTDSCWKLNGWQKSDCTTQKIQSNKNWVQWSDVAVLNGWTVKCNNDY